MSVVALEDWTFDFCGGELALDFANTVESRLGLEPLERLGSYARLVAWGVQAGALGQDKATALLARARRSPPRANELMSIALELRESLFRLFRAHAHGRPPHPAELVVLNGWMPRTLGCLRIEKRPNSYGWRWTDDDALDRMLMPVARSATELLTQSARLSRVRICSAPTCGWLYIDTSKNGRRRWCSMERCGNREKARRHYQRQRLAPPG